MALTDSEIARCRHELGYNLITTDGAPWIGTTQAFETIIQQFLGAGTSTVTTTAVTAATEATPVAVTLSSAAGFAVHDRVAFDVGERYESSVIAAISGSVITVALTGAHAIGCVVSTEGGESIVREILRNIARVKVRLAATFGAGGLKAVDEIQFYASGTKTLFGSIGDELMYWRDELSSVFGIPNRWRTRQQAGSRMSVY